MAGNALDFVRQYDGSDKHTRIQDSNNSLWHEGLHQKAASTHEASSHDKLEKSGVLPAFRLRGGTDSNHEPAPKDKTESDEKQKGEPLPTLPKTDEGAIVSSLNRLAADGDLKDKAAAGQGVITQDSLATALLIAKFTPSLRDFLTKEDRASMMTLLEQWSRLDTKHLTDTDIQKFSSKELRAAAAAGHVANGAATGATEAAQAADHSNTSQTTDNTLHNTLSQAAVAGLIAGISTRRTISDQQAVTASAAMDTVKVDVPMLDTSEFTKRAQAVFAKIDKDGDGILSKDELAKAIENNTFKGHDAQVVAALYQHRDELNKLSNDQWGSESGITISDLAKFEEIDRKRREDYSPASQVAVWLSKDEEFKKLDKDGDGYIAKVELENAIKQPGLPQHEREMISYMLRKLDTMQSASNDEWGLETSGITRKDVEKHFSNLVTNTPDAKLVGQISGVMWRTSESQKHDANFGLYGTTNPLDSIKCDAIKQGMIGDCYFLSALASVARTNPEQIQKMIKDNGNGTYTVTFPGAPNEPITVTAPTEAEAGLYNGVGKHGTWALVIEKAYGKYCQESVFRRSPFNLGGGNTPAEGGDGGGRTSGAMKLLTGKGTNCDSTMFTTKSTMYNNLLEAFSASPPRTVTAGINKHLLPTFLGGEDKTEDGFPRAHAYSIVGFKPDGKGGGTVIIRNPWGGADNTTDGTKEISLDQFMKNFSDVTIEEK